MGKKEYMGNASYALDSLNYALAHALSALEHIGGEDAKVGSIVEWCRRVQEDARPTLYRALY